MIDPELGHVWGGTPGKNDIVLRMVFLKRRGAARPLGKRQGYNKQPIRWMKVGWYAEYMEDEWSATRQKRRCRNRRLERL